MQTRARSWRFWGAAIFVVILGGFAAWQAVEEARSGLAAEQGCENCSVIWVVIDTTRADRFAPYGGDPELTPSLNGLAARGTTWIQSWSQAPATMLSVASYLTGRHRSGHGMMFRMGRLENAHTLDPAVTTLAEVLEVRGLRTVGYVANSIIAPRAHDDRFGLDLEQGFQQWTRLDDQDVADAGADFLSANQDERFFLYLHLMGPHLPNHRAAGFKQRRGDHQDRLGNAAPDLYRRISRGEQTVDASDVAFLNGLYDDALQVADRQVGQVLDRLQALGLEDTTLVIFSSDHGEVLGDYADPYPRFGHSIALNQELLNVPLILAGPGIGRGVVEREQVAELVDLAPTVTSFLGIGSDADWGWEGKPLWGPQAPEKRVAFSDFGGVNNRQTGARTAEHVVRYHHLMDTTRYFTMPDERTPVAPGPEHLALEQAVQVHLAGAQPTGGAGEALEEISAERLEELNALGYME